MPSSVRFPRALDNDSSLYLAVNNQRTRLTAGISNTQTTIPVITTSGFPTVGFISILTGANILNTEAIAYSGTASTNFLNAERGADGTTALPHNANDNVDLTVVSRHHNNLKDAVIELERYVGVSGTERFVPFQFPGGNVILPGTLSVQNTITVSGGAQFAFVTVTGTLTVGGDFDFKSDGAISGTLTVGEIPVATGTPTIQFNLEDGTFSTSSVTYVDVTGSVTGPLPIGNNLLLYSASAGSTLSSPQVNLKCVFAGADIGEAQNTAFLSGDPFGSVNLGGFKIVTGDGVNTAKLQVDLDTGSSTIAVSARSLLSIPLAAMGLVLNDDYWFSNGSESTVNITSTTFADITTVVAVLPATGDYLVFGSAEMANANATPFNVRYQIDSTTISTTYEYDSITASADFKTFPFARLITTTGGSHTFRVQAARDTAGTALIKRARLCIIRANAFSKVSGLRSNTDFSTASSTFAKVTSSEITYTPNQRETIVVIANPDAFITSLTGPPATCYKLVNETSGLEYMIDSAPARYANVTTDLLPGLMFTKIDHVATPQTFSLSFRDGEATGNTITHNNVNMIVWSMTTAITTSGTDIQYTVIDGDRVRAHELETDILEVFSTATVSGIPVMINVPEPLFATTAFFNNVTVTGSAIIKDLTVTGTARFEGNEVGVSGILEVQGDATFCSAIDVGCEAEPLFAFQDTEQQTQSTTFIDANCETTGLRRDVEYLVMYAGAVGGQFAASNLASPRLRLVHGSDEIAIAGDGTSPPSATFANNGVALGGFTVVTGTGASLKLEFRDILGSDISAVDAMSIVAIPLENLNRGEDYFYDVQNSSSFSVTNAPTSFSNAGNRVLQSTFNIPATGTYLYLASVEAQEANAVRKIRARFYVDNVTLGPEHIYSATTAYSEDHEPNFQVVDILPLGPGNHTFRIEGASTISGSATADFRRGRNILIRVGAFDQLGKSSRTTTFSTASSTFSSVVGRSYTPRQNEKLLVIGHGFGSSTNTNSVALACLRDDTSGINYREDSGYTQNTGGLGTAFSDTIPTLMLHMQDVTKGQAKTWRFMGRSRDNTTIINWGTVATGTATNTDIFTWSMTNVARTYTSTIITSSGITAHNIRAEGIHATESLTISGVPVSTGTGGGTLTDAVLSLNDKTGHVTISGFGGITVTTSGQNVSVSGSPAGLGFCYTHVQSTANSTWSINHTLATEIVNYIVLDANKAQVEPDTFTINSPNLVTITFAVAQSGTAYLFPCGTVVTGTTTLPDPLVLASGIFTQSLTVSGVPVSIGASTTTLQQAYNNGNGVIVTTTGKPVVISGTGGEDQYVEFKVVGSGIFTEAITIGDSTTYLNPSGIQAHAGDFVIVTISGVETTTTGIFTQSLTVSGSSVLTGASTRHGSMNFTTSLTVSGLPVSLGGGGGSANTLQDAYDNGDGRIVLVSGKPLMVISGSPGVDDVDFDVWGDVGISGTLDVRQDITALESVNAGMVFVGPTTALGAASLSNTLFASQDTIQSTTSTALVNVGCETPPLSAGVEYVIFYSGLVGALQRNRDVELVCTYGSTVIGRANLRTSDQGTTTSGSMLGGFCSGFYKVTGDGSNSVKFQHRGILSSTNVRTGPLSIVAMPLNDLAEGEDYFYIQQNGDTPTLTDALELAFQTVVSGSFNIPVTEPYLVLMSVEGTEDTGVFDRFFRTRFLQNSTVLKDVKSGPDYKDSTEGEEYHSVSFARVVTLNSGLQHLVVEGRSANTAVATLNTADFRRGRIFAFRKSTFEQIVDTNTTSIKTVSATSFGDVNSPFSALDTTYTPNHSEKVILLTSLSTTYTSVNSSAQLALRDDTAGVNHRSDFGMHNHAVGVEGSITANENTPMLLHLAEFATPKTWKVLTRDPSANSPHVGAQGDSGTAIRSDFILWGLSLAVSGTTRPVATTVTATGITTPSINVHDLYVHADAEFDHNVVIDGSLTVSGQPIAIGDFVRTTGDDMTGNLNMNRKLVQNAGVVAVQNAAPTATVTGLLWFDADAIGSFPSDPNLPVGGIFASTSVITSGTVVASGSTVVIPWNTSLFDQGTWFAHSDASRLTVPSGVTHIQLHASVHFQPSVVGERQVFIFKNGNRNNILPASGVGNNTGVWGAATVEGIEDDTSGAVVQVSTPIITTSGNDFFQVAVRHTSSGTLQVSGTNSYFSALAVNTRGVPGVNSVNALKGDISVLAGDNVAIASNSTTNAITISGTTTLQKAYDNGPGTITTTAGKPVHIVGTAGDGQLDFKVTGSGNFTEGLSVGSATTYLTPSGIVADRGQFQTLTISGQPVATGTIGSFNGVMLATGNQFLTDNAAGIVLDWTSEVYDFGGWHTNTSGPTISGHRITIPAGVSMASFSYQIQVTSSGTPDATDTDDSSIFILVLKNGGNMSPVIGTTAPIVEGNSNGTIVNNATPPLLVSPGDYFELQIRIVNYDVNAGTNGTRCYFSAKKEA
jgi:hypothetical protein